MKVIPYKDREVTRCPTREFCCIGPQCAVFKWQNRYDFKYIEYIPPKQPWYKRLFLTLSEEHEAFKQTTPPELEGWDFYDHWRDFFDEGFYYRYRRPAENPTWYCGLGSEG